MQVYLKVELTELIQKVFVLINYLGFKTLRKDDAMTPL